MEEKAELGNREGKRMKCRMASYSHPGDSRSPAKRPKLTRRNIAPFFPLPDSTFLSNARKLESRETFAREDAFSFICKVTLGPGDPKDAEVSAGALL